MFEIYTANFPDQVPQSEFSVENRSEDDRGLSKDQYMKKQYPHLLGIHNCTVDIGAELGKARVFFFQLGSMNTEMTSSRLNSMHGVNNKKKKNAKT